MNIKIGETNIICSNLDRSLKFCKEVLGFEFIEEEVDAVRIGCGESKFYCFL